SYIGSQACATLPCRFARMLIARPGLGQCFSAAPSTAETETRSLHDALPISERNRRNLPARAVPVVESRKLRPKAQREGQHLHAGDRKSTRLNSSHVKISYAVFCLKKKKR